MSGQDAKPMTDSDRQELERLRAIEAERRAAAIEAEKNPPKSLEEQMKDDYIQNRGTIQTIARHYKVDVDVVLHAIGQAEMAQVETMGDLIDSNEIGPQDKPVQASGQTAKVPFSLN